MKALNKLKLKLATYLLHSEGFQFAALKAKDGVVEIEGDVQLIRYIDTAGYFWKREPKQCKCKH